MVTLLPASPSGARPPAGFNRGFGVSPSRLQVDVRPGRQAAAVFSLSNLGRGGASSYTIEIHDLGQNDAGGVLPVPVGSGARSCAGWTDVPARVSVPGGSSRDVEVKINCPPGARGAYYAVLKLDMERAESGGRMTVAVRPSIGISLEVRVPGPATAHLEAKELVYDPGREGSLPALGLRIENTGQRKKPVEGDAVLYDRPGQFPLRVPSPYGGRGGPVVVYPGLFVRQNWPLPRPLPPGRHRVSIRLRLDERVTARKDFELEVPAGGDFGSAEARSVDKTEMDVGLLVEPDLVEMSIPAGGHRTVPLRLRNEDTREASVRASVMRARMETNGMFTYAADDDTIVTSRLDVEPDRVVVQPGRAAVLRLRAGVPRGGTISDTGVWVVLLRAEAGATEYHDDWRSGGEFPVPVIFHDPRDPPPELETADLEIIRPGPGKNPTAAVLRVRNTGGRAARATGGFILERTDGETVATMKIGAFAPEIILPGSEREFRMPVPLLDRGGFRLRAELHPGVAGGGSAKAEEVFSMENNVPMEASKP